jgi:hypothetical protein
LNETVDTKIIERIQKLLNLTQSPNEGEATAAAEGVQRLLTKYNLEMEDVSAHTPEEREDHFTMAHDRVPMGPSSNQSYIWCLTLAHGVARATFCNYLYGRQFRNITFIGRKVDVQVAKDLYKFLSDQMMRIAWDESHKQDRIHPQRFRTSFLEGCALRVSTRLIKALDEEVEVTALSIRSEEANKQYISKYWPKLSHAQIFSDRRTNEGAFNQGYEKGASIKLKRDTPLPENRKELGK